MEEIIRIEWDGPFGLVDIGYSLKENIYQLEKSKLNHCETDYGLYQIYGYHPIYGSQVLLYIGKAIKQTFAKRLSQEDWIYDADFRNLQIYVGRLFSEKPLTNQEHEKQIDHAEKMLIYSHSPAMNSSNILNVTRSKKELKNFEKIRILNYDCHRSLMPEISGELWLKGFDEYSDVFKKIK